MASSIPNVRTAAGEVRRTCGAALLYAVVTLVLAWPLALHPRSSVMPGDPDTDLFMWTLAWNTHAVANQPLSVFDANIYNPHARTLAFSENLLGSTIFAAPVLWTTGDPLPRPQRRRAAVDRAVGNRRIRARAAARSGHLGGAAVRHGVRVFACALFPTGAVASDHDAVGTGSVWPSFMPIWIAGVSGTCGSRSDSSRSRR
jgi:hypothetical protein